MSLKRKFKKFIIRQEIFFNIFFGSQIKHIRRIILNTSFEKDGLTKIIQNYYVLYSFFDILNDEYHEDINEHAQRIVEYIFPNTQFEYVKIEMDSLIIKYKL